MSNPPRRYFDNAATSWPKPEAVYAAVEDFQRRLGASAGRGHYREAVEVERLVQAARRAVGELIGVSQLERIVFTANGTDSLNLALHGLLKSGDHVITTVAEHNSVLRPLHEMQAAGLISVTYVSVSSAGVVDPQSVEQAWRSRTRLVVMTAASNVTGAVQPVKEVGQLTKQRGGLFLLDAAQALGHFPLTIADNSIDLLAAPGHKGLLGPLGTGILYIAPGIERQLKSTRQGGTGSRSDHEQQPDELPDKFEAGNLNVPGILGLRAGVEYVLQQSVPALQLHEKALLDQLLIGLQPIPGLQIHGPATAENRVGVVSLTVQDYDPQELSAILDTTFGIQTRAGLHCSPRMHATLGTLESGGTVRLSVGPFTTSDDIAAVVQAFQELTS